MNKQLLTELAAMLPKNSAGAAPEILTDESPEYEEKRKIFNTRFQFRPSAIVLVETTEQVSEIVKFANRFPTEITLRVRSGGHDHEGECSGTDTLLIDFSKMKSVKVGGRAADGAHLVTIGPGARFECIKPSLDKHHIGIAHGTCETVGITGYTLGGGWGPWTRRHGMGSERLVGATLVLGNGEITTLGPEEPTNIAEKKLLWALRGGGGLSYGIVTELTFKAFELPETTCTFVLNCKEAWPDLKALEILQCWEKAISAKENPQLLGTNLKVVAVHLPAGQKPNPDASLECIFNGYFAGTKDEASQMLARYFGKAPPDEAWMVDTQRAPATDSQEAVHSEQWLFDHWDHHVPGEVKRLKQLATASTPNHLGIIKLLEAGPAPHKITSRLADASWDDESRKALICALQSPLVAPSRDVAEDDESNKFPIAQYITLGAITGPFYATYDERKEENPPSAFPYKDRLFTLQFQAWWDEYLNSDWKPKAEYSKEVIEKSILANRPWVNRAEDWIEACRDYSIPHTSGAFINFKDSSVRTETYFAESYEELREVKQTYSMDKHMLLRSGKTII